MDYRAYRRRNDQTVEHLTKAGFHGTNEESLAGGYYGVDVPLESGYHVHLAQDSDQQGEWAAGVSHEGENYKTFGEMIDETGKHHDGQPMYDMDVGIAHPREMPDKVGELLRGPAMKRMQAYNRNLNSRQFDGA